MLRFLPSPAFRFNCSLLASLSNLGGCVERPDKRVFVNLVTDGLAFHTMARFREVTVRLIESGGARVSYTNNATEPAIITHKDYDRKDLQKIAGDIVGFLEDRLDPAKLDGSFN